MSEITHFLGVDPGKKGAFAILSTKGDLMSILDMPLNNNQPCPYGIGTLYIACANKYTKPFSVIEKPQTRPTDGKKGVSTYFLGAGYLMMPVLWDWPIQMIPPTIWTRNIHVGLPSDLSAKKKSLLAFQALFPKLAKSKAFVDGKKIYDGRIDAVLIAEYARRLHSGITD
jgi:hypothetical protein